MQSLQVVHPAQAGNGSDRQRGKESNATPFVLRPRLLTVELTHLAGDDDDLRSGQLQLRTNVVIGAKQRVVAVLNEWGIDRPVSYLFDASPRNEDSSSVTIPLQAIKSGEYLVRLMVDGAESQLQIDDNPDSPTYEWYAGPKVIVG